MEKTPHPRVPTLESSDLPSVPWAHSPLSPLWTMPRPHPFPFWFLPGRWAPVRLWSLAYLRKMDNSNREDNWCLLYFFLGMYWGLFYLILVCLGRCYLLLCVFSSKIHIRTRFLPCLPKASLHSYLTIQYETLPSLFFDFFFFLKSEFLETKNVCDYKQDLQDLWTGS